MISYIHTEQDGFSVREGHNPQTGKIIKIAATKVPAFKADKDLKDAVKK